MGSSSSSRAGVGEQQLCKREQLLLAAREVVGVVGRAAGQAEAFEHRRHRIVAVAATALPLAQLVLGGVAHEQGLRILRQKRLAGSQAVVDAATLRLQHAGGRAQERRLAAAVAADDGMDGAGRHVEVAAAQHPGGIARVAHMGVAEGDGRSAAGSASRPAAQGRRPRSSADTPQIQRPRGEARERHRVRASVTQFHGVGGVGGHRLRSVRRHHHGDAQLAVHAEERMQEVLLGHWVQLGGGFVEHAAGAAASPACRPA